MTYNPYNNADRRSLATDLLAKLKEAGFSPQENDRDARYARREIVMIRPMAGNRCIKVYTTVITTVGGHTVRGLGEDSIKIATVYRRVDGHIRGIDRQTHIHRMGQIANIVGRVIARVGEAIAGAASHDCCGQCGAPKFTARSGRRACTEACWAEDSASLVTIRDHLNRTVNAPNEDVTRTAQRANEAEAAQTDANEATQSAPMPQDMLDAIRLLDGHERLGDFVNTAGQRAIRAALVLGQNQPTQEQLQVAAVLADVIQNGSGAPMHDGATEPQTPREARRTRTRQAQEAGRCIDCGTDIADYHSEHVTRCIPCEEASF